VGHSFGAILGYEVLLRLLRLEPDMVAGFMASGSYAPRDLHRRPQSTHNRQSDRELVETLRGAPIDTPDEGVAAMLALIAPSIRSELDMLDRYRPGEPVRSALAAAVVISADDPFISCDAVSGWTEIFPDARLMQGFAGGHNYLETHAQHMVACLHDLTDETRRSRGTSLT
jgi:surfactin synthase thioesterase subunit